VTAKPAHDDDLDEDLVALRDRVWLYRNGYLKWRKRYERLTFALGIPAALFAAAATVTALKDVSPVIVAVFAALASALSGIQLFMRPADRAALNRSQHVDCDQLATEIDTLRKHKVASLSRADAIAELERLQRRFYDLERRAITRA
jgi:hypothetical protein